MPFVKHCFTSALTSGFPRVWFLDGINNKGLSGGPVVFGTGPSQKIMAVTSGYIVEPADFLASPRSNMKGESRARRATRQKNQQKTKPGQNSGLIVAYDIEYALKAIRANPIGPSPQPSK